MAKYNLRSVTAQRYLCHEDTGGLVCNRPVADSSAEAKYMAERGESAWLDATRGEALGVEAMDVSRAPDIEDEMTAWKERDEA